MDNEEEILKQLTTRCILRRKEKVLSHFVSLKAAPDLMIPINDLPGIIKRAIRENSL